jgi:hypothetical protein
MSKRTHHRRRRKRNATARVRLTLHGASSNLASQGDSPSFQAVDSITRAAEAAGWPSKQAFECGMQLVCHGTTVGEARALFEHAARTQ